MMEVISAMSKKYILAIDSGTTSSRAIVFNHAGLPVGSHQLEHEQIFPQAGWVEHDPKEIWTRTLQVVEGALVAAHVTKSAIAAIGITNQRETTVVWNKTTGDPVYNAIVWQDTRTEKICQELAAGDQDRYRSRVGLPLTSYFAGPKVKWILDNVPDARAQAEAGDLLMGTIDSWLVWNLTGGVQGGLHLTDVTNASRTLLMNLKTLDWDLEIAADMSIPPSMLPQIVSSSRVLAPAHAPVVSGVPIAGILGDQQAATFGQACFEVGMAKNTYGTGCFMLMNTGTEPVFSKNGLLTTLCYQIGDQPAVYALEGSIAVTGSLIQWLRDNLKIISSSAEAETLALSVPDNGGVYFVPAFSGLFAPYWRGDARGVIAGLTRFCNRGHIARAALEATAFQTREVVEAMEADAGAQLTSLKVDGGMTANQTLMQFQADQLGVPVVVPVVPETTALGASYAAGIAVGYWAGTADVVANWTQAKDWQPMMELDQRERLYRNWKKAVTKTFDWVDDDVTV
ncbi:MAG: glycerol kinase GlpK [Propionibacteriaceae bacterium]|jgi:glycerol kinase|nr:glycerol kinase GlpK [Propionibacteriaceae bacterium]